MISYSTTFFIIRSNDHKECDIVIKKEIDKNGIEVKIINYGATINSIKIPLKTGKIIDVVIDLFLKLK